MVIRYRPSSKSKRCQLAIGKRYLPSVLLVASGKPKSGSGGSMVAKLKLKGIDERAPQKVELGLAMTARSERTCLHAAPWSEQKCFVDTRKKLRIVKNLNSVFIAHERLKNRTINGRLLVN